MLKHVVIVMVCLASFGFTAHGDNASEQRAKMAGSETAPGKVVRAFHTALKNQDAEKARSFLADDVTIVEGSRIERSANEYASHHMRSDMKFVSTLSAEPIEHTVKQVGSVATSLYVSDVTTASGKQYRSLESIVLSKRDGQWKIAHIHWSTDK